jgi:hypothetical protein
MWWEAWQGVRDRWSSAWTSIWDDAQREVAPLVERNPEAYERDTTDVLTMLSRTEAQLVAMRAMVEELAKRNPGDPDLPTFRKNLELLQHRYDALAAGVYSEAQPASDDTGFVPLLIIVVGVTALALSAAAIAWAYTVYELVNELNNQTEYAHAELAARLEAMRTGKELPTYTGPKLGITVPTPGGGGGPGLGTILGLGAAAVGTVVAVSLVRSR